MNRRTVQYLGITSGAALVTAGTVLALSWSSRAVSTSPGGLPEPTGPGSARPSPGPGRGSVSDFRLAGFTFTSHRGEDAGPSLFDDEVTALVFFFTSCRGPCPRLMGTMAGIERRTAGEAPAGRLRFAAISVDGTRDTPEVLTSYAARLGLDTDRWSLLTGDPALVARLASESLDYDIRTQNDVTISGPAGDTMQNILHPTRIMLVGPDRRLIGIYAFTDADAIERLIADAARALDR